MFIYCISATIHIGCEIHCLTYVGFFSLRNCFPYIFHFNIMQLFLFYTFFLFYIYWRYFIQLKIQHKKISIFFWSKICFCFCFNAKYPPRNSEIYIFLVHKSRTRCVHCCFLNPKTMISLL